MHLEKGGNGRRRRRRRVVATVMYNKRRRRRENSVSEPGASLDCLREPGLGTPTASVAPIQSERHKKR